MLAHAQTSYFGDRIVMVSPKGPYVPLPTAGHGVRFFPQENKTVTPVFNSMRPNPGVKRNETPKKDNTYCNGYDSSKSILIDRTHLSGINNHFYPPINPLKYIPPTKSTYKPELAPVAVEQPPNIPQPEPEEAEGREPVKNSNV